MGGGDEALGRWAEPASTRIDEAPTRLDQGATRRDGVASDPGLTNLPAALGDRYTIVSSFATMSSEADLLLVRRLDAETLHVAKVYRHGVNPKSGVLDTISRSNPEHVVSLIEHGVSSGRCYELLEYMPLGSLRDVFPPTESIGNAVAKEVLRELNDALHHLHEQGIIHRDLKPANVLVRCHEPLDLVLTDFGIASRSEATAHYTSAHRTIAYAAPETVAGEVSAASDYWSLGIMLAELVTGRHPLHGMTEHAIAGHLIKRTVPIGHLPASWRPICAGLLLRNPRVRWGYSEVRRWLANDTTLAAPPPEVESWREATTPYKFRDELCYDASQLARTLVTHPIEARKHLARGYVSTWIASELKDHDLASYIDDCCDRIRDAPDLLVLAATARMDPRLEARFRNLRMEASQIGGCALQAVRGDRSSRGLVADLYQGDVLEVYATASRDERILHVARKWRGLVQRFDEHLTYFSTKLGVRQAATARSADALHALLVAAICPDADDLFRSHARSLLDDRRFRSAYNAKRFTAWLTSNPRDAAASLMIAVFLGRVAANQALVNACRASQVDVSRELQAALSAGANPDQCDEEGVTPLHWLAQRCSQPKLLALLLDHGAPLDAIDAIGRTPLMRAAAANDHPEVVRTLVQRGARLGAKDGQNATAHTIGLQRGARPDILAVLEPNPPKPTSDTLPREQAKPTTPPGCMSPAVGALFLMALIAFVLIVSRL